MIKESLRNLCILSIFCGAALSLSPESSVKKIMSILVSAILILTVLQPLKAVDFSVFAAESARIRESEHEITQKGSELQDRLSRLVIEEEYKTYIRDKAAGLGIKTDEIKLCMRWSTEGFWIPESVEITCSGENSSIEKLRGILTADLGMAPERQIFNGKQ